MKAIVIGQLRMKGCPHQTALLHGNNTICVFQFGQDFHVGSNVTDERGPDENRSEGALRLGQDRDRQVGLETGRIGEGAAISLYLVPVLVFVVWAQLKSVRKEVL